MTEIRSIHEDRDPAREGAAAPLSPMDVPRARRRSRRPLWLGAAVLGALGVAAWLTTLEPASRSVQADLLEWGTVRRGPMVRQVHGWGALVPDRTQILRSEEPGRVAAVYVTAGQSVRAGDRLVEIENAEIQRSVERAEQKFAAARAGMIALSRESSARRLALEASINDTRVTFLRAEDELEELRSRAAGKVREIELKRARERLDAIGARLAADEQRLELIATSMQDQMGAQRDELRWVEQILQSERKRLESLTLRAAGDGIVEKVGIRVGSRVEAGDVVAEIGLSDRLKAEIRCYESDARDLKPGQSVSLKAGGRILSGHVASVRDVPDEPLHAVDVALHENPRLPDAAGGEVEALIEIGTLEDVVSVERPPFASAGEKGSVFRLSDDGKRAVRTSVVFGRGSTDRIEIVDGLRPGDRVVISDVSMFDGVDSFEIE